MRTFNLVITVSNDDMPEDEIFEMLDFILTLDTIHHHSNVDYETCVDTLSLTQCEYPYPCSPVSDDERFCPKCGSSWAVHNGDGSCVDDEAAEKAFFRSHPELNP